MKNRLSFSSSNFAKSVAAVSLAVFLAVVTAGSTYALWSDIATVPGATITAGSATLAASTPVGIAGSQLYPGQSVTVDFTVHNTGDVPLGLSVDALTWPTAAGDAPQQAFADAVTVSVWPKTGDACSTQPPASAWTAASTSNSLGVELARGAVQSMCIAAALSLNAPNTAQGGSLDFHLTLGGVQT